MIGTLTVNIPLLLALNIGTSAMLMLAIMGIVVRQRHFNTHGKEAMMVFTIFVLAAAMLRWLATNEPELLPTEWQRIFNGWIAIACASIMGIILYQAEVELHAKKLRSEGKRILV